MCKIVDDYAKEQVHKSTIEDCKNVIKVGLSLDKVLEAFSQLDANIVRDLFAQFSPTFEKDITIYAKDSRLAGPSDGQSYDTQKMISYYKKINRTLTEEEVIDYFYRKRKRP